ncbi:MAG: NADH-quinone oxidoreductase subunit N [Armatimonadetes bacterium]|nr:NADH-quinone oxidoreductase subunit N [Armatimonadota bacterium]
MFDYTIFWPEIILCLAAMLVLLAGVFPFRKGSGGEKFLGPALEPWFLTVVLSLFAVAPSLGLFMQNKPGEGMTFGGNFVVDEFAIIFKLIAILSVAVVALMSVEFLKKWRRIDQAEFYSLLLFSGLAMALVASSADLIMIYLSIEFLSLTGYVMAGYLKNSARSVEASVKYFLYGAVSAAVMLYGMSLLYGMTGATSLGEISRAMTSLPDVPETKLLLYVSFVFILVGLGFKIAIVPFHQWSPDVYEGAPMPVTAFLSVGPKAAGFAALVRLLVTAFPVEQLNWVPVIAVLAAVTMTFANVVAITQRNVKRMLAYSSIAHAGYVLVGLAAYPDSQDYSINGIALYLLVYLFMNLGAFAVATAFYNNRGSELIEDYSGLSRSNPRLAMLMAVFMLSLTGLPPTAGFVGKFYLFLAAVQAHLIWLAVFMLVNTAISLYYYFNIVRYMYLYDEKTPAPTPEPGYLQYALAVTLIFTLFIGVYPQWVINLTDATRLLWGGG